MQLGQLETTSDWQKTKYSNLVRFRSSGTLFARFKARGKLIRLSLETSDLEVGKRKLDDLVRQERGAAESVRNGNVTFTDALSEFRQRGYRIALPGRGRKRKPLKERTRNYYEERITALLKSWPSLEQASLRKISQRDCESWADGFSRKASASAFNHTISVLRQVMQIAIESGARHDNPALLLGRMSEKPKKLQLPTRHQFERFVNEIEHSGCGWSRPCADLVRFLAFSGLRKSEAANVTWADVDFDKGRIMVWGDPQNRTKNGESRIVPMIPDMRALLERLRLDNSEAQPSARVMRVRECQKAMDRAAAVVGIPRLTHHDLRHLFATRCIESGVDIPTLSRWLGHKDGGALAMKVYGHLRDEHSASMAQKVTFATEKARPL